MTSQAFLEQCGGYTPTPDILVEKYGHATAHIWGVVWRFCQGELGHCEASTEKIANRAGMSERSAHTHLKVLIGDGYIQDKTPEVRNKPHILCTKIGEEKILGLQNLRTKQEEEVEITPLGLQKLQGRSAKIAGQGLQKLQEKKVFKDTIPKGSDSRSPPQNGNLGMRLEKTTPKWQLMNEFIQVTQIPLPDNKPDESYFWQKISAIYNIALKDVETGKRLIRQSYKKLIEDNLTVSDPGSLVKTARAMMAKGSDKVVLK